MKKLFQFIIGCFKSGEGRTQKLKRNVVWSTIIKVGQMAIELVKVPILLTYLDNERYGLWLTIVSILLWAQQFDLGLGSGLRYKLTESIANNDIERGRKLVSTAYVSMMVIMLGIFLISTPIIANLNWNNLLNVTSITNNELRLTILLMFLVIVMQFVLELISVVLRADQRAAISDIFKPLGSIISLVVVLLLGLFSSNSLLLASLAMSVPYVLVLVVASFYFFGNDYKQYSPKISMFDKSLLRDIYSLGIKYFLSALASLIVFGMANVLLSHFVNPSEVTTYSIARTYYGLMVVFYTIILVPFAAATTDAYVRRDMQWVKRSMSKLKIVAFMMSLVIIMMLIVSKFAIHLWVGDKVVVPWELGCVLAFYNIMSVWVSPYANFLGAVGKLNIRVYIAIFKIITFIPCAIFAIKQWGSVGLVFTIIVINTLVNLVFGVIQYRMIINNKAKGIWNR